MIEIKLRRLRNKWTGDTIDDQTLLLSIGAPMYFEDSEYDAVLEKAGAMGVTLVTPLPPSNFSLRSMALAIA